MVIRNLNDKISCLSVADTEIKALTKPRYNSRLKIEVFLQMQHEISLRFSQRYDDEVNYFFGRFVSIDSYLADYQAETSLYI